MRVRPFSVVDQALPFEELPEQMPVNGLAIFANHALSFTETLFGKIAHADTKH